MKILHVNNWLPVEANDGGRIRKLRQIAALRRAHDVWVLGRVHSVEEAARFESMIRGIRVVTVPEAGVEGRTRVASTAREVLRTGQFEAVHVSGVPQWPGRVAGASSRIVVDVDSLESRVLSDRRHISPDHVSALDVASVEALERTAFSQADRVLVCSPDDRRTVEEMAPGSDVRVVPNGVDLEAFPCSPLPGPRRVRVVTFTGFLTYWPNADACVHFAQTVLPLVRADVGEVMFRVVGRLPPAEVMAIAGPDTEIHANVEAIQPFLADADVVVVPLRAGSGTRLKILEAFAAGRPVVSTPIGCEGLPVAHGTHLLVAPDDAAFVRAVAGVLRDRNLAERLARNGRDLVERHFDWERIGDVLLDVYRGLSFAPGGQL